MSKDIELIYSQQDSGFVQGRAYSNPRFFSTPRSGVSKVFIVGEWPNIVEAYTALGVPVERLDGPLEAPPAPAAKPATGQAEDPGSVVIPDDWKDLAWSKPNEAGLSLRGLASQLSPTPILNKEHAYAAIQNELYRRWLDEEHADALGLTRRELFADLTQLGVQWTDADAPADLLRMRDEARALAEAG